MTATNLENFYSSIITDGVQFLQEVALSDKIEYDSIIPEVRVVIDELALTLNDTSGGHAIVMGHPTSGKSFIIEQFVYNADKFTRSEHPTAFLRVNNLNFQGLEKIPGGYTNLINRLTEYLNIEEENMCFVTESPVVAQNIYIANPKIKVILEVNTSTYISLLHNEDSGATKIWASWGMIDANALYVSRKNLVETLHESIGKQVKSSYSIDITEDDVKAFVNKILKEKKFIHTEKPNKGLVNVPVGFFGNALRRASGLISYSSDPKLMDKNGNIVKSKVWAKVAEEVYDEFSEISMINSSASVAELDKILSDDFTGFLDDFEGPGIKVFSFGSLSLKEDDEEPKPTQLKMNKLSDVKAKVKESIIGQDEALDSIFEQLVIPAAGLNDPRKPLRSLMFFGPTGVGKTETTLQLAKHLFEKEINVIRLDMSEYAQEHESSKLFGSPAGYVGHEEGGILTNAVLKNPNSIILLDEVEKAHASIWRSFLQIFDSGRMTDNKGKVVDFTKTLIFMTSNLGVKAVQSGPRLGFGNYDENIEAENRAKLMGESIDREMKTYFAPEFINRIDGRVIFKELKRDVVSGIVAREIEIINSRLKNATIKKPSPKVIDFILERSKISEYGAREIQRNVQKLVTLQVAFAIQDLEPTGSYTVSLRVAKDSIVATVNEKN